MESWKLFAGFAGFVMAWSTLAYIIMRSMQELASQHVAGLISGLGKTIGEAPSQADLQTELLKFELEINKKFVRRNDCIRNTNVMDHKLDGLVDLVRGIDSRLRKHEIKK